MYCIDYPASATVLMRLYEPMCLRQAADDAMHSTVDFQALLSSTQALRHEQEEESKLAERCVCGL